MDPVPKLPAGTLLAHGRSGIDLDGAISAQLALGCAAFVLETTWWTIFTLCCIRVLPKLPAGTVITKNGAYCSLEPANVAHLTLGCATFVLESSCYTVFAPRCVRVILAPKHPGGTVLAIDGASSPLVFTFRAGAALASTSLVLELTSRTLVALRLAVGIDTLPGRALVALRCPRAALILAPGAWTARARRYVVLILTWRT